MEAVVELHGVSRMYGDHAALDRVTLTVSRAEFVCLVGPSGAGKTTLLNIINRSLKPSSGQAWVAGLPVHQLRGRDLSGLRRKVATVFQDHKLLPELSALENVAFAVRVTDIFATDQEVHERALSALQSVEMGARASALPRQLSHGQCQRVALARAIVTRPALILADEPTGNLDERTGKKIVELLHRFHQRGTAVILATHDREHVRDLDCRVVTLSAGRVVTDRNPATVGARRLHLLEQ